MKQKQLRWLGLILILVGVVSIGLTACEKKEAEFSQLLGKRGFSPLTWRKRCRRKEALPFKGPEKRKGGRTAVWEIYRNISVRAVVARSTLTARSRR